MVDNARIEQAIEDLRSQSKLNLLTTAKKYNIVQSTLCRRFKGKTVSPKEARSRSTQHLTDAQEKGLIEYINKLADRGFHPAPKILENLVVEILGHPIGRCWIRRFCLRHKSEIKSIYIRGIDQVRSVADNAKHFQHYFDTLEYYIEKYRIKPSNIYNFDEKGFLPGQCRSMKRIVAVEKLKKKQILGSNQDGSREFISLLATVCADGTALAPALIHQAESHDLQEAWLEDYDHEHEEAFFAASKKGWTNEELGFSWLEKLFETSTRAKASHSKRLLIVDGHSSHLNMRFIDFCDAHNILLGILPPHSTHRLQPLDVAVFSPLATAYSRQIDDLIQSTFGFSRITKRKFWSLFRNAWSKALTKSNIEAGFAATGIWLVNPSLVLQQLPAAKNHPSNNEAQSKPLQSTMGFRQAVKQLRKKEELLTAGMDSFIRACEQVVLEREILEHEVKALKTTLIDEKKRYKRGKLKDLLAGDEPGQAMFFSPTKIAKIRAQKEEMEGQKEQERLAKEAEKERKAKEREEKAQLVQDRKTARQQLAAEKREAKERAKEAAMLQKQANQQLRSEESKQKKRTTVAKSSNKHQVVVDQPAEPSTSASRSGRNGRNITLPTRFGD